MTSMTSQKEHSPVMSLPGRPSAVSQLETVMLPQPTIEPVKEAALRGAGETTKKPAQKTKNTKTPKILPVRDIKDINGKKCILKIKRGD